MSLWFDGTYGGKKYTPSLNFGHKSDAEKHARFMRSKGYSARIYSPDGSTGKSHMVFIRKVK